MTVSGSDELAEQLQRLHAKMDLDWEGLLIRVIGETPGHWLFEGVRSLIPPTRQTDQWLNNMAEYLQDELSLLPARHEIEQFTQHVDALERRVNELSEQCSDVFCASERNALEP